MMACRKREHVKEYQSKRFRKSRTSEEERDLLVNAVPISTRYKNKWAVNIFTEWIRVRANHSASLEETSLNISLEDIQDLDVDHWETMTPASLDFWFGKFVQEVLNKNGERYPGRTLYQVVGALKRHLESKNRTDVNIFDKSNMSFAGLRRILDAEMKDVHTTGITNTKAEKKAVTDEEEEQMWREGLLGDNTAKSLLHTVYYYNGKLFGMRSQEHRLLRLDDITIENNNTIAYRENSSKTFHGGIADMKKKGRVVKHFCHKSDNDNHERCLIKIYSRYFALISKLRVNVRENGFYFQAYDDPKRFEFKNCVVGIHSLNNILPSLCAAIGSERKTSHSLRVTCVSKLFNANVKEKLIRNRSGHVSDALMGYEKSSEDQELKVSKVLNPPEESKQVRKDSEDFLANCDEFDSLLASLDEEQIGQLCSQEYVGHSASYRSYSPIQITGNCSVTINQYKL